MPSSIRLGGAAAEARRLNQRFDAETMAASVAPSIAADLKLCLNEAAANILSYAFERQPDPMLIATLRTGDDWAEIELRDNGFAFDPLSVPPREKMRALDEGPLGGFGVQIMRENAARLAYRREVERGVGWNVLTFRCG